MAYLHPIVGGLLTALLLLVGTWGMRSRHRAAYAKAAREAHRRWAPWMYGGVVAAAAFGTASVLLFRDDIVLAESWHFWLGWIIPLLLTGGYLTSRRIHAIPAAKKAHPLLGLGAMALAVVSAALGLGILP